jgi:uncharacterized protein (TIGR02453 family)
MSFAGFTPDALAFYRDLATDPTKAWWQVNKDRYEQAVRAPMTGLVEALAPRFGEPKLFRPYKDIRFAKGASPYKDHQGAFVQVADGIGWYVQLNAEGLMVSGGYHAHASDQTARFRAAVDDDRTGAQLAAIVADLKAAEFGIWGRVMKTRPRGVPADHPRLELMRHQNLTGWREPADDDWVYSPQAVDHVAADWEELRPLVEWLATNVGPTDQPSTPRAGRARGR